MPSEKTPFSPNVISTSSTKQKEPVGPMVGAGIVVILMVLGALYFWGSRLNQQNEQQPLPLITGNDTSAAQ